MRSLFVLILLSAFLSGCAEIPIKDGELALGANSSATVEGGSLAKIKNRF